ncbi:MAG: RNA polymerase sigma factor [Acidobacteriota bacterium]|nr:RNA polymerase sigma factor [Acidobacteriota bacterium]
MANALEDEARLATAGDRDALNRLVAALQGDLYGLSLRMLCNREDAEDATQEILIRIVTRLSQFDFRSKLKTWAYRVAVNYILDVKKSAVERLHTTFEQLAEDITEGLGKVALPEAEQSLLVEEVKIGCSLGMLQCLDRDHRLAYILGEVMEMQGPEAAEILEISPELFRKRLQVARTAMLRFMKSYCGLASDAAPCRCNRQVPTALSRGRISAEACNFAAAPSSFEQSRAMVRQVEEARWALQVHRTNNPRPTSVDFARRLLETLDTHRISGPAA